MLSLLVVSDSCDPMDCSPSGSSFHGDSPGKNTGVGCHSLLQGMFPTQGSNPGPAALQAVSLTVWAGREGRWSWGGLHELGSVLQLEARPGQLWAPCRSWRGGVLSLPQWAWSCSGPCDDTRREADDSQSCVLSHLLVETRIRRWKKSVSQMVTREEFYKTEATVAQST